MIILFHTFDTATLFIPFNTFLYIVHIFYILHFTFSVDRQLLLEVLIWKKSMMHDLRHDFLLNCNLNKTIKVYVKLVIFVVSSKLSMSNEYNTDIYLFTFIKLV